MTASNEQPLNLGDCPNFCVSKNGTVPFSPQTATAKPNAATEPDAGRRGQSDRRQQPTSPWGAFPPAGQRMRYRRQSEHLRPYFVDRFSAGMMVVVLMLALASIVDAWLTIDLLEAGADEINPLMARLLEYGVLPFLLGKYVLTVIGIPLLLIFKNYYLFGTSFRVGHLIPLMVSMYAVLIAYQILLIHQSAGL
jgi:hypothetical protein